MKKSVSKSISLSTEYEKTRYSYDNILRSERVYGDGFQSPGGLEGFKTTLYNHMPDLKGKRVLDLGSGLGGSAIYVAQNASVEITGVDPAPAMVQLANEQLKKTATIGSVRFVDGDVFLPSLATSSFDVIYTKDALVYDHNKLKTLKRCFDLLVPGGQLFISDFCTVQISDELQHYVEVSNYELPTIGEYKSFVQKAAFRVEAAIDVSKLTLLFLDKDLALYQIRVSLGFLPASDLDVQHIAERWLRKITFMRTRNLGQILIIASIES